VTKRNVLEQLSKQRLIEIAQALEIHLGVNKPKADFVDAIVKDRRGVWPYAPTDNAVADVLNLLSRDELKAVCRGLGLDETGRSKQEIIDRMVADDDAEDGSENAPDGDTGRRGAACRAQNQESETDDTGRTGGRRSEEDRTCPPSNQAESGQPQGVARTDEIEIGRESGIGRRQNGPTVSFRRYRRLDCEAKNP
jgi:hypothetical protein